MREKEREREGERDEQKKMMRRKSDGMEYDEVFSRKAPSSIKVLTCN